RIGVVAAARRAADIKIDLLAAVELRDCVLRRRRVRDQASGECAGDNGACQAGPWQHRQSPTRACKYLIAVHYASPHSDEAAKRHLEGWPGAQRVPRHASRRALRALLSMRIFAGGC